MCKSLDTQRVLKSQILNQLVRPVSSNLVQTLSTHGFL